MQNVDVNAFVDRCLDLAAYFLSNYGEFMPFALALDPEGEIDCIQGNELGGSPEEMIEMLVAALQQTAEPSGYLLTAIVSNVSLVARDGSKQDAVRVDLEMRDGPPLDCFVEYELKEGEVQFGQLAARPGIGQVFPPSATVGDEQLDDEPDDELDDEVGLEGLEGDAADDSDED